MGEKCSPAHRHRHQKSELQIGGLFKRGEVPGRSQSKHHFRSLCCHYRLQKALPH